MISLRESRFSDLLAHVVDNRGKTCPTAAWGTPLIATNCVTGRQKYPTMDTQRFVDDETMRTWFRGHPQPGDILFVCKGAPGRVAVVPDPVPFCIAQDMVAVRADPAVMHQGYLYYLLSQEKTRSAIGNLHVGTMIPHFKKGDFPRLKLQHHESLETQRAIAEVLGALDDKITTNERVRSLADDLRGLIFSTGLMDAESVPLSEMARFVNGRNFTKDASGGGRPVVRIAELNSGLGGSTVYSDSEVADDHVVRAGDLLFAWSGSLTLRRWYLQEGIVNQHIFKVLPASEWPLWLVASVLERKLADFKAIAADKATTMGHIQRRHLDAPVPVPTRLWLESNGPRLASLWDLALATEIEVQQLTALRDALLPELMSGRLRVKDAEKTVEEVV